MSDLFVIFRVAESSYVLSAAEVLHMESFTGATRVPGAARHVVGVVQVRGRVLPVVDLRMRFGMEALAPGPDTRMVVVQQGKRSVALLADCAREVVRIDPTLFRSAPEMMGDADQGFVKSVARVGDRLVMWLDLEKAIGEDLTHGH